MSRAARSPLDGVAIEPAAYPALREIALAALICNDASLRQAGPDWIVDGDPMEGALIAFAIKAGIDAEDARRDFPRLGGDSLRRPPSVHG